MFRFDTAVCLFLILDIILYGSAFPYSVKDVALSFVAWSSVGNSNWYIFAILFAYFFTFISYKVCNKNYELLNIAIIVVFCCVYIVIMHIIKESYWYNTILCYPLGMIWSLYKEKIRIIFQNIWIWIFGISLSFIIQSMSFIVQNIFITMISYIAFTILIVLLTMKVSINNKILAWCGKHLFGIFILQRIPMIILKEFGIYDINIYLSFIVSVVVTLLLSAIYDALIDKVWKRICKLNNL